MGFISKDVICGNANLLIPNATTYDFGILTSILHMAWMRVVCGRIKSDYRYSADIVYNNFLYFGNTMNIVDSDDGKALSFEFDSSMKKDLTNPATYDAATKFAVYDNTAVLQNLHLLENTSYTITFDYLAESIADTQSIRVFPVNNGEANIWGNPIDFRLTQGAYFDITPDILNKNNISNYIYSSCILYNWLFFYVCNKSI
jgi:hypothetical protein